jgi:hypothetical protein
MMASAIETTTKDLRATSVPQNSRRFPLPNLLPNRPSIADLLHQPTNSAAGSGVGTEYQDRYRLAPAALRKDSDEWLRRSMSVNQQKRCLFDNIENKHKVSYQLKMPSETFCAASFIATSTRAGASTTPLRFRGS